MSAPSLYGALSTDKLLSLVDSKIRDIRQDLWLGEDGCQALDALLDFAGLAAADSNSKVSSVNIEDRETNVRSTKIASTSDADQLIGFSHIGATAANRSSPSSFFSSSLARTYLCATKENRGIC